MLIGVVSASISSSVSHSVSLLSSSLTRSSDVFTELLWFLEEFTFELSRLLSAPSSCTILDILVFALLYFVVILEGDEGRGVPPPSNSFLRGERTCFGS